MVLICQVWPDGAIAIFGPGTRIPLTLVPPCGLRVRVHLTDPIAHSIPDDLVLNRQLLRQDEALPVLKCQLWQDGAIAIFGPGTRIPHLTNPISLATFGEGRY